MGPPSLPGNAYASVMITQPWSPTTLLITPRAIEPMNTGLAKGVDSISTDDPRIRFRGTWSSRQDRACSTGVSTTDLLESWIRMSKNTDRSDRSHSDDLGKLHVLKNSSNALFRSGHLQAATISPWCSLIELDRGSLSIPRSR